MINKNIILVLYLVGFHVLAIAQQKPIGLSENIDSLIKTIAVSKKDTNKVNLLNKLSYELNYSDMETAKNYAWQALTLATALRFNSGVARAYYNLGVVYKNNGSFDSAEINCLKSVEIYRITGDSTGVAGSENTLGTVNYYQGNYSAALQWYEKALSIYEYLKLSPREAIVINNVGLVYSALSNYEKALDYYFRSLKIQEKEHNRPGEALTLANIGIVYFNLGDEVKALEYYKKSLAIRLQLNDEFGIAQCYNNMGNVYESFGQQQKALSYYQKALDIYKEKNDLNNAATTIFCIGYNYLNQNKNGKAVDYFRKSRELSAKFDNKSGLAYSYMNLGIAFFKMNRYDSALVNLNRGLRLFTAIDDKNNISYSYQSLSDLYKKMGNYKKSLYYFTRYSALRDSLYSEESSKKIAEAEVRYETGKKENSIKLLTKEKELQNLQLDKQKTVRNSLIAFSILILALAIIIYSRFVIKRKANKLLEEKNRALGRKNAQIENQKIKIEQQSEKLKELDEAKSRFFANISHEFRTPLMLIKGPLSDFIQSNKEKLSNKDFSSLNLSLRSADKLNKLIGQLLDLSKLESGSLKLQASKSDLVSFVKRVVDSFASAGKNHSIVLDSDRDSIPLYFDMEKMETVLTNLLSNAYKFTPENGKISLTIRAGEKESYQGSFVTITVTDTGTGIEKEKLPFVFDRFYQADNSSVRKYEGTGIGLALTKELVELHGGTISVKSEPGEGTTFTIMLPQGSEHLLPDEMSEEPGKKVTAVDEPLSASVQEVTEKRAEQDGGTILIVEDNEDMRNYISGHVSGRYQVVEAVNGKEGLAKAIESVPDLIVSDLMMPEMDGMQFLREIRNNTKLKDIPFILLTARAGEQDRISGLKAKADDYLTKPFSPEELMARINNMLETRRNLKEKFSKRILSIEFDNPKLDTADNEFLKRMRDAVIENISDSTFGVENLVDKAFLSERQLRRKLKELTGLSPVEFIRQIRLLQAKELLMKRVFNNVAEVSVAVGFNNPHYFSRLFKKMFGKSPNEVVG